MADPFDNLLDETIRRVTAACRGYGESVKEELQRSISEPYPPASEPYTPPHRRTGNLWRGISFEMTVRPGEIRMRWISERVGGNPLVPRFLELGTPMMAPRPYMEPMAHVVEKEAPSEIARRAGATPIT